jgi:hypothetical protein
MDSVPVIMAAVLESQLYCRWLANLLRGKLVFLPVTTLLLLLYYQASWGTCEVDDGQISLMTKHVYYLQGIYGSWGRPLS